MFPLFYLVWANIVAGRTWEPSGLVYLSGGEERGELLSKQSWLAGRPGGRMLCLDDISNRAASAGHSRPLQDTAGDQHYSSDNWQERDFFPSFKTAPVIAVTGTLTRPLPACSDTSVVWGLGKNLTPLIHQAQDISCSYLPDECRYPNMTW